MTKTYCDRCGKDCMDKNIVYDLPCDRYDRVSYILEKNGQVVKEYDLCQDCFEELRNWIKIKNE